MDGGTRIDRGFDFAFGPMNEYLDVPRTLTLKGKAFHVFSFEKWNSQLRLIKGCYSGQENVVSELLKVGAPDEMSPLFTFNIRDSSSPAGVFLASVHSTGGSCFRGGCGPAEGSYLGLSEIAQKVGMSLCVVGASFCHSFSSTANAISGMLSLRRVLTAVQFGNMRPGMGSCGRLAANVMGAYLGCCSGDAD